MKANELMIGDWVKCVDSTYKKKVYAQVIAIEEGQACILVEKDNCNWLLDISSLKPIPLTAKILEKNGFVRRDDLVENLVGPLPFLLSIEETATEIYIGWRDSYDNGFRDENEEKWDEYWEIDIDAPGGNFSRIGKNIYVHELQHALRLCGINKEIKMEDEK